MRKFLMPLVAAMALGCAAPAMAYDSGDVISMHDAVAVATSLGLAAVSYVNFEGDQWEIEGRDPAGRWMKVWVDAYTGEVRGLDRW
jgi:Peptidase propeptide and YPEB domain